jgi:SAM-dependent methyltransferase
MKQSSPSCERNKEPILAVLREILSVPGLVLEIGSGSGQHAVHFARGLPHVEWQPTDVADNLPGISAWRDEAGVANLREPLALDLFSDRWPVAVAQAVVCINTIHIVSWVAVKRLFAGVGRLLKPGGTMYVYGPYRYADRPLEPSNEEFDRWLKARDSASGVRLFEDVNRLAGQNGLMLAGDRAMPANNRSIWWIKNGRDR